MMLALHLCPPSFQPFSHDFLTSNSLSSPPTISPSHLFSTSVYTLLLYFIYLISNISHQAHVGSMSVLPARTNSRPPPRTACSLLFLLLIGPLLSFILLLQILALFPRLVLYFLFYHSIIVFLSKERGKGSVAPYISRILY